MFEFSMGMQTYIVSQYHSVIGSKLCLALVRCACLAIGVAKLHLFTTNTDLSSPIINITECSVPQLGFTLMEPLGGSIVYTFLAVCKVNAECVSAHVETTLVYIALMVLQKRNIIHNKVKYFCSWISQMEGILHSSFQVQPTVGSTFRLSLHTSCSLSNTLTPRGTGLCTLLLSTSNVVHDSSGTAFIGICTLSSSSGSSSSTSVQTTGEGFVQLQKLCTEV